MDSMHVLLALAATRGWSVHHLDVKSSFVNGELEEWCMCDSRWGRNVVIA
jgi:hypothetical protein